MKKLQKSATSESGGLPFLAEAYEMGLLTEGEVLEILSVRESRSKKGFLLTTEKCLIFLFKSSAWVEPLLDILNEYVTSSHGYAVSVVVREEEENGIEIHIDENIDRIWIVLKKFGNGIVIQQESINTGKKIKMTRRERAKE